MSCGLDRRVIMGDQPDSDLECMMTPLDDAGIVVGSPRGTTESKHTSALLDSQTPQIVVEFSRLIQERNMSYVLVNRLALRATLRVQESDLRRGLINTVQQMEVLVYDSNQTPQQWWNQFNDDRLSLPFALSASLTSYDASRMPLDTQISLCGMRTMRERQMGAPIVGDSALRDHVLPGTIDPSRPSRSDCSFSMLTRPLVCFEPLTNTYFGSIEAIGFEEKLFWRSYAKPVPEYMQKRIARLFPHLSEPLTSSNTSRFYLVDLTYRYTDLLMSVHVYLTLQQLRRESEYEIDEQSVDVASYQVPCDSIHAIFDTSSLNAAVRFVSDRLVDVHPSFHPSDLSVNLEPFCYPNWTDAWQAQNNRQAALTTAARVNAGAQQRVPTPSVPHEQFFELSASFLIYFATFDRSRLPKTLGVRANGFNTTRFNALIGFDPVQQSAADQYSLSSSENAWAGVRKRQATEAVQGLSAQLEQGFAATSDEDSTKTGPPDKDMQSPASHQPLSASTDEESLSREWTADGSLTHEPLAYSAGVTKQTGSKMRVASDYGSWTEMVPQIAAMPSVMPDRPQSALETMRSDRAAQSDSPTTKRTRSCSFSLQRSTTKSCDEEDDDETIEDASIGEKESQRRQNLLVTPMRTPTQPQPAQRALRHVMHTDDNSADSVTKTTSDNATPLFDLDLEESSVSPPHRPAPSPVYAAQ